MDETKKGFHLESLLSQYSCILFVFPGFMAGNGVNVAEKFYEEFEMKLS